MNLTPEEMVEASRSDGPHHDLTFLLRDQGHDLMTAYDMAATLIHFDY